MISLIKRNWKILRKHKNRVDIERNERGKSKDYNDDDGREDGSCYVTGLLSSILSLYILQHIVLIFYWFFLFILSLFSYTNHQVKKKKKKKKVELSQAERSVDSLDCVWMAFRHWCPYRNRQTDRQRRKKKKTTMMKKREMMDKNVSSSSIFLFSIWIIIMSLCVPSRSPLFDPSACFHWLCHWPNFQIIHM